MAYNKETLLKQATEAIQKHKLFFVQDVVAYMPCGQSTFYAHFPAESEEMETLKEAITKNKVEAKVKMRKKWLESDAPALQLALYKLASTPEELKQLQMQHVDHTSGGQPFSLKDLIGFKD